MHDWRNIAEEHGPLVWRVAFRVLQDADDAADCHQEVFVDAMRRTSGKSIDDWPAFLRWLTVRRAIDRLRCRQRDQKHIDSDQMMSDLPLPASAEGDAEWNVLIDVIRSELTKIPDPQAQVFWLHCVEEVSLNDISMQLETSVNHIRVLLHRSRSRLRAVLQRDHPSLIENRGNERTGFN